jgi:CheY-like chemotaxis protein
LANFGKIVDVEPLPPLGARIRLLHGTFGGGELSRSVAVSPLTTIAMWLRYFCGRATWNDLGSAFVSTDIGWRKEQRDMTDSIDVLIIEPSDGDARRTAESVRQANDGLSIVRVLDARQASRLMFEQGLYTKAPQLPKLIIADLGDSDVQADLPTLRSLRRTPSIPLVILSAHRSAKHILDAHRLGAQMNLQKPDDPREYAAAVKRIIRTWSVGGFAMEAEEAW